MSDAKYAMFIKAVDKKSLALAAQELCCTPSAVSHGISALETELGLKLMKRSRGGVELTAEGEHVIGAVRGVLEAMERGGGAAGLGQDSAHRRVHKRCRALAAGHDKKL